MSMDYTKPLLVPAGTDALGQIGNNYLCSLSLDHSQFMLSEIVIVKETGNSLGMNLRLIFIRINYNICNVILVCMYF